MSLNPSLPYPAPPAGYHPAELLQYPKRPLQVAALLGLLVITPGFLGLTWVLQAPLYLGLRGLGQNMLEVWPALGTVLVIIILHELVHGMAYQLLGYQVRYGVSRHLFAAYAAAFGQWQKRDHNLIVALAPLIVLNGLALPLLALPHPALVLVGLAALLMNTAGAVGDLYLSWRLLRLPRATLLYDVDVKTMLIYRPQP